MEEDHHEGQRKRRASQTSTFREHLELQDTLARKAKRAALTLPEHEQLHIRDAMAHPMSPFNMPDKQFILEQMQGALKQQTCPSLQSPGNDIYQTNHSLYTSWESRNADGLGDYQHMQSSKFSEEERDYECNENRITQQNFNIHMSHNLRSGQHLPTQQEAIRDFSWQEDPFVRAQHHPSSSRRRQPQLAASITFEFQLPMQ